MTDMREKLADICDAEIQSDNPSCYMLADALIAALPELQGWQPIETAPKDGEPFLTFSRDAADDPREGALGTISTPVLVMAWLTSDKHPYPVDEHGDWHDFNCYEPTHWRPLPSAPSAAGREGE